MTSGPLRTSVPCKRSGPNSASHQVDRHGRWDSGAPEAPRNVRPHCPANFPGARRSSTGAGRDSGIPSTGRHSQPGPKATSMPSPSISRRISSSRPTDAPLMAGEFGSIATRARLSIGTTPAMGSNSNSRTRSSRQSLANGSPCRVRCPRLPSAKSTIFCGGVTLLAVAFRDVDGTRWHPALISLDGFPVGEARVLRLAFRAGHFQNVLDADAVQQPRGMGCDNHLDATVCSGLKLFQNCDHRPRIEPVLDLLDAEKGRRRVPLQESENRCDPSRAFG